VINQIFIVHTSHIKNKEKGPDLILRISNPHKWWEYHSTLMEVEIMNFVKKYTNNIPLPIVLSYSYNASTSKLGCAYILMNKMEGVNLSDKLKETLNEDQRNYIKIQFIALWKEIYSLTALLNSSLIGGFGKDMIIVELHQDGPTIGPFNNFTDMAIVHINWAIEFMKRNPPYHSFLSKIHSKLDLFLNNVVIPYKQHEPHHLKQFYFSHLDFHGGNLLIDPITAKITAVLDWDCKMFTLDDLPETALYFSVHNTQEEADNIICELRVNLTGIEIRKKNIGYSTSFK